MPAPPTALDSVTTAADFLRQRLAAGPAAQARIGIVLGSGLGAFADQLVQPTVIEYSHIPGFPSTAVLGHQGRLVGGLLGATPVIVLQGRVHAYEGYSAEQVVFPVRTLAALGLQALVLTNAAGGVRLDMRPGQFVLISDQINLSGLNPAAGTLLPQTDRPTSFGPRFFDMGSAYSKRLREIAHAAAASLGSTISEGVYLGVLGPSFETPAEIRAFRLLGADLVGMSTVLETIAARQMGIEVLGLSCVTNMAAGIEAAPLSHLEVMETGRAVEAELAALLGATVPRIARELARAGLSLGDGISE